MLNQIFAKTKNNEIQLIFDFFNVSAIFSILGFSAILAFFIFRPKRAEKLKRKSKTLKNRLF